MAICGLKMERFATGCLLFGLIVALLLVSACSTGRLAQNNRTVCDVALRGGLVIDGTGAAGRLADVLIRGDKLWRIGGAGAAECAQSIDVSGLVVAPGFINMLSWATESLLHDPRALSDVYQGVTLEVMGEGRSMGPWSPAQVANVQARQGDLRYAVNWQTLGGYFARLEAAGLGVNVASFVGATTVREHVLGAVDRAPSAAELAAMRTLVREAMAQGALGVGSSLIYAPANYAATSELVALVQEAAAQGGGYISHLRSEGFDLLAALDELLVIARASDTWAQIYHLKASGRVNWHKLDAAIARVEAARAQGLDVGANIYPYTAGATGLDAVMPPWVQEGGIEAWIARLQQPAVRARVIAEMRDRNPRWENFLLDGADNALLLGFKNPQLRGYIGKTLAEVARLRGTSAEEAAIDLVIADGSEVDVAYFFMDEKNVRKKLRLPWVSVGSDASAPATEGVFLNESVHPRAYGSFARVLGRYVREERLITLVDAVHRMTGLPAQQLRLQQRGTLVAGNFADVAVFDAAQVADIATFEKPHRYAAGMRHVFVNGRAVLSNGKPTGELPGQIVRGPGWMSTGN